MDVDLWRLFVQIAEHGSITRVATARDVAQSVVSRQLATIERICGGRLFDRTGRGVRLNEAGLRIYPRAVEWLEAGEQLSRDARFSARVLSGTVRVGVLASISHDFSRLLYQRVNELYPHIHLRIVDGPGRQISQWLEADALDFGFVVRNYKKEHRGDIPIGALVSCLVGPVGDVLTQNSSVKFSQLDGLPLVFPSSPNVSRELLEHMARKKKISIRVALECDSIPIQKHLVADGRLYAILGAHAVRDDLLAGKLQASKIVAPEIIRSIVLGVPESRQPSASCRAVLEIAREIAVSMLAADA
ncbi:LysR family transcriptional regulator [uncultured Propionivibrio sp.]|uniref:LysR family transcriptional regulator n=1 Tax=uncultured Propionivibrio sp. TaxID=426737 RepID=UPI0029C02E46|nr:LysR family transcriptional regulator [uncultured Propionivibrio sp.]